MPAQLPISFWVLFVHLCDLLGKKKKKREKRKCVKTTLRGVNIIWINEAISYERNSLEWLRVNSHHLDN